MHCFSTISSFFMTSAWKVFQIISAPELRKNWDTAIANMNSFGLLDQVRVLTVEVVKMSQQKLTTKIQQRHTLISSKLCLGPEYVWTRKVKMLVAQSCLTLSGPHGLQPARLLQSMKFSRQEYWSGLPFPFPGDLWDPGIKPRFTALQVDLLHYRLSHQGSPWG